MPLWELGGSAVLKLLGQRRPSLRVTVKATGGGTLVDFSAHMSNVGDKAAMGCIFTAELDDGIGEVFRHGPFNLRPNEIDRLILFGVERPRYGGLIHANNNETTLYGRVLTVRLRAGWLWRATARYREPTHHPQTDGARYQAQQDAWERGRPLAKT